MKLSGLVLMMSLAGGNANAELGGASEIRVTVCTSPTAHVNQFGFATRSASQIFATVGVTVNWQNARSCQTEAGVIEITFQRGMPEGDHPGALAYAYPFGKPRIVVLCDRVTAYAADRHLLAHHLLAYVLLHEITHVLQGVDTHSRSGIMKAKWTYAENFQIRNLTLGFTASDSELIHANRGKLWQIRTAAGE